MEDNYNPNNFGQEQVHLAQAPLLNREPSQSEDELNLNADTVYDNNLNDANLDDPQDLNDDNDNNEEEEGESVYMIDGVVMKVIQIEGEDNQYLMDPSGRIYDMQANFIGTANTQGLDEMNDQMQTGDQTPDENDG